MVSAKEIGQKHRRVLFKGGVLFWKRRNNNNRHEALLTQVRASPNWCEVVAMVPP